MIGHNIMGISAGVADRDGAPVGGLEEVLTELSPIEDFSGSMSLSFSNPRFEDVKASLEECKDKDMTYAAPLKVTIRLTVFDKNHAVLANPLVRRAMTHAIDRQAIVDSLWAGRTVVPKGLQWDYYDDMFVADWDVPAYDPKVAQDLLRQAGRRRVCRVGRRSSPGGDRRRGVARHRGPAVRVVARGATTTRAAACPG